MFTIQYDGRGFFRLTHTPSGTVSEWANYRSLAILIVGGKTYVAGSGYGLLPRSEQVYELTPQYTVWKEAQVVEEMPEEHPTSPVLSLTRRVGQHV